MGIEEDLEQRLSEIDQSLYEEQKASAQKIIEYIHELLRDLQVEAKTDFKRVTVFLFLKGFHIFEAVKILCEKDHAISATILLRTLLEGTANLLYIYKRPQQRSKRFLAHGPAGTMVMLETLEYINPDFAEAPLYEAAKEMISKQREGIDFDYKPEYNWARKSHAELIKETLPKLYFGFWKSACFVAHPNMLEFGQYIREKDGKLVIHSEPTKSYRAYALLAAQGCFLLLLETFSKVIRIQLSAEIQEAIEEQKKLYS